MMLALAFENYLNTIDELGRNGGTIVGDDGNLYFAIPVEKMNSIINQSIEYINSLHGGGMKQ